MTACAAERATVQAASTGNGVAEYLVKTGITIWKGALVATDATGYALPAVAATLAGWQLVGVAQDTVVAGAAASGTYKVAVRSGVFRFGNSGSGDAIAITDVGKDCYFVDDQTVAKTSGALAGTLTAPRGRAGRIVGYSSDGVDVLVGLISSTPRVLVSTVTQVYATNDLVLVPVHGGHYDVPTTGAASTISLTGTGLGRGSFCVFTADGTKNGHTVTYRDGTTAISAAATASKRHVAFCIFDGTNWACLLTVGP